MVYFSAGVMMVSEDGDGYVYEEVSDGDMCMCR